TESGSKLHALQTLARLRGISPIRHAWSLLPASVPDPSPSEVNSCGILESVLTTRRNQNSIGNMMDRRVLLLISGFSFTFLPLLASAATAQRPAPAADAGIEEEDHPPRPNSLPIV